MGGYAPFQRFVQRKCLLDHDRIGQFFHITRGWFKLASFQLIIYTSNSNHVCMPISYFFTTSSTLEYRMDRSMYSSDMYQCMTYKKDEVLLYTYAIDRVCRDHSCSILDIRQRRLSFQKRHSVMFLIHGLVMLVVLMPSQSLCCRVANAINLCRVCCQS